MADKRAGGVVLRVLSALGLLLGPVDAVAQGGLEEMSSAVSDWELGAQVDEARVAWVVDQCVQNQGRPSPARVATLNNAELWALAQICNGRPADFREFEPGYGDFDFTVDCERRGQYRLGPDFLGIAAEAAPGKNRLDVSFFVFDDAEADAGQSMGGPWASLDGQIVQQPVVFTDFAYDYSRESGAARIEWAGVIFRGEVQVGLDQSLSWFNACPDVIPDGMSIERAQFEERVTINLSPYGAQLEVIDSQFRADTVIRFAQGLDPDAQADLNLVLYPAIEMSLQAQRTRFDQALHLYSAMAPCGEEEDEGEGSEDQPTGIDGSGPRCEPQGLPTTLDFDAVEVGGDLEANRVFGFSGVAFDSVEIANRLALVNASASEICDSSILPFSGGVRFTNVSASTIDACLEVFPDAPPTLFQGQQGTLVEGTGFNTLSFGAWRNLLTNPKAPSFLAQSSFSHTTSPLLLASSYFDDNQLALTARDTLYEHAKLRTRDAPAFLGLRSLHNTLQYEPLWTLMPFFGVIILGAVVYGIGASSDPIGQLSFAKRIWVSMDFTLPILQLDLRHEALIPHEGWVRHLIYVQRLAGAVLALYFAAVLTVLGL